MLETVTIKGEGITLDLLLWRRYGRRGQDLLDKAFLLNPGLAAKGYFLPLGTTIIVPDMPKQKQTRRVVNLFGE